MKKARCIISLAAALFFLTGCSKKERYASEWREKCSLNLKKISGAKEEWALENRKTDHTLVSESDISGDGTKYLRGAINGKGPEDITCPAGGMYSVNPIGEKPTCSISSHNN